MSILPVVAFRLTFDCSLFRFRPFGKPKGLTTRLARRDSQG